MLSATNKPKDNVIPFIGEYNFISPVDLEEIMETFNEMGYLSEKGIDFRTELWRMFIYKKDDEEPK